MVFGLVLFGLEFFVIVILRNTKSPFGVEKEEFLRGQVSMVKQHIFSSQNSISFSKDLGFAVSIHIGSNMVVKYLPVLYSRRDSPSMLLEAVNKKYSL